MSARQKFATQIDGKLLEQLRAIAFTNGRQIQGIVEEALSNYIHDHANLIQKDVFRTAFEDGTKSISYKNMAEKIMSPSQQLNEVMNSVLQTNTTLEILAKNQSAITQIISKMVTKPSPDLDVLATAKALSNRYKGTLEYLAR